MKIKFLALCFVVSFTYSEEGVVSTTVNPSSSTFSFLQFLPENCPTPKRSPLSWLNPWYQPPAPEIGSVCNSPSGNSQYQVLINSDVVIRVVLMNPTPSLRMNVRMHPKQRGPLKEYVGPYEKEFPDQQAEAVVNGGFFDVRSGAPIGFLIQDNHFKFLNVTSSKYRSLIGIHKSTSSADSVEITELAYKPKCSLIAGEENWMVQTMNVSPPKVGIGLFTAAYGEKTPLYSSPRIDFQVLPNEGKTYPYYVARTISHTHGLTPIPGEAFTISTSTGLPFTPTSFQENQFLSLRCDFPETWETQRIWDGFMTGPLLLRAGEFVAEAPEQEQVAHLKSHNRMVLGTLATGETMVAWFSRSKKNQALPLSFEEVASQLKALGVQEAIGLDGGHSSAILFRTKRPGRARWISHQGRKIPYAVIFANSPSEPLPTSD